MADAVACIEARGLRRTFGDTAALDGFDLTVEEGRIVGLLGANGAGKTTALRALVGLTACEGTLRVLGRDPRVARHRLMHDVAFVGDVAVLPRWMRVSQALDFVAGVHPRFDRARAESLLARTDVRRRDAIGALSRGAVVQLHLALVLAIDARLLVLDEPTLGLDLPYRKQFYDTLLADYLDRGRTIVLATHEVDEIQDVVTDVALVRRGRVAVACAVEALASRYAELVVHPERLAAARALGPLRERQTLGRSVLLFDGVDRWQLGALGEVRTPSLADVFHAVAADDRAPRLTRV